MFTVHKENEKILIKENGNNFIVFKNRKGKNTLYALLTEFLSFSELRLFSVDEKLTSLEKEKERNDTLKCVLDYEINLYLNKKKEIELMDSKIIEYLKFHSLKALSTIA